MTSAQGSAAPTQPETPSFQGRWLVACFAAALCLSLCELVLLSDVVSEALAGLAWLWLPLLMTGNLLPYVMLAAALFALAGRLYPWLRRWPRPWVLFALVSALGALPYALRVSYFAFSGPQMLDLAVRPLLIALGTVAIVALGVALYALAVWQPAKKPVAVALAMALTLAGPGCLLASASILPHEYEPLHAFLMVLAIASMTLAAAFWLGPLRLSRKLGLVLALFGFAWAGTATVVLAKSHGFSWVVWGGTPGTRYVTHRLRLPEKTPESIPLDVVPEGWANSQHWQAEREARRSAPAPHFVVFSVDNLQTDHVGAYGYRKNPTTPNIDRIAERGVVFERAYSYYPQTRIFMSSMLFGRKTGDFSRHQVSESFRRLALTRLLKQRNYHVLVKGVFELTAYREFEPKDYAIDTWLRRATAEEIRQSKTIPHIPLEERFQQLEQHLKQAKRTGQPVFVWMHLLRPHRSGGSFVASDDYDFGSSWLEKYDSAVAATDEWLPKIQELMDRHLGGGRDTVWVIQSDHAAGLWQGQSEKGKNLLNDHVHVPLIIAGPGVAPGRVSVPVDSAVDTAATVLDLAGISPPVDYDGASLVPLLMHPSAQQQLAQRGIYLEQARWQGAVWKQYKLVVYRNAVSLFDVEQDPRERHNIAEAHPALVDALRPSIDARAFELKRRFRAR